MQEWSSIIIIHVGMSAISSERRKLENFKIMAIYGFLYVYIKERFVGSNNKKETKYGWILPIS
jgi:hypothetical protein